MDKNQCKKCKAELLEDSTHDKCKACSEITRRRWLIGGSIVLGIILTWLGIDKVNEIIEDNKMSDEELKEYRENVRLAGDESVYYTLKMIDREIARRTEKNDDIEDLDTKPRHREHGWYLPNDD